MALTDVLNAFESGDFARTNLFEVEIPHLGATFRMKCKAATMPAATIEKIPVGYMNRKLNVAGDRTYDDWSVTVYNEVSQQTRQEIVDWNAQAHGMGDAITGDIPANYKKTAVVRQLDRNQNVTKEYQITGLFPIIVGEIALDWDDNNAIQMFEVVFAIDWWE